MAVNPNDPRLTSMALGEMNSQDTSVFEAEIAGDSDAMNEIGETREFTEMLGQCLQEESSPTLTDGHRRKIRSGIFTPHSGRKKIQLLSMWIMIMLTLAILVIAGITFTLIKMGYFTPKNSAGQITPTSSPAESDK